MAEILDPSVNPIARAKRENLGKKNGAITELIAALKSCSSSRDLESGRRIHARAVEAGSDGNLFVANTLIDMYAKAGSMPDARSVFDVMKQRSLVSWNTIVLGYAQCGEGELALELFEAMQGQGFLPDSCSMVAALRACTSLAEQEQWRRKQLPKKMDRGMVFREERALEKALALHALAAKRGHESNLFVASSLVNLYCKVGKVDEAVKVFDRMKKRSVVTWNSIIIGCAQNGEGELAMRLFSRMQEEESMISPDSWTFVAALEACIGLAEKEEGTRVNGELVKMESLEKGMEIHSQARERGHTADMFVANTLIDMYSKCGRIVEALAVFDRMKTRDLVSWNIMLLSLAQNGRERLALTLFQLMQHGDGKPMEPDSRTYVAALKACSSLAARETPSQIGGRTYS
ncbi:pentatricopeptide repeat-containing protein At4g18520, chloroplastic-like [Selaginella moellendorffii]|uniref:pentatricopeptide repeat-containing protein At4g18520, chloroplastic-like n=1 Tax=Selaginella moellendorffii TaxID=88036 RepID=UPI000D1D011E|nr:pentatricopeptide repeat-containing protein At4g18520, chloroplastic-like [Selaginella moellendorffii]|eukprot:XP_024516052.1 pentatricopeptide repeat-containing protein At4g18520, chloroplastic-like [Selaginella moellendorffii]